MLLKKLFPSFGSKNIKLYYILTIFLSPGFILPNWVFYFGRFISIPAIGLIDGLSKLIAVIFEIPSGAVSDLLGKKKTLIMGNLCFALCSIMLINSTTFTTLLIGNLTMFIGFAFLSGAKEAILYDTLTDIKQESHYDEVLGRVGTITMVTTITTIFAGGFLYSIKPELTFWAWLIWSLIAVFVLLFIDEPIVEEGELSYLQYISKLKSETKSIFQKSFTNFTLPVLFFAMLIKAYEGVVRQNTGAYFGFNGETFGYLMALITIPTLLVSYNFGKIVKTLKERTEYLFIALYLLGFAIVYLTNSMIFGVASFLSIYVAQEITKPFITSMVNKHTDSRHRATALSTVSLFSEIPYMIIVIFFGFLLKIENIPHLYLGFIVAVIMYRAIPFLLKKWMKK